MAIFGYFLPFCFSNSKYCSIIYNIPKIIKFTDSVLLDHNYRFVEVIVTKNQHLLIFDDFGNIFDFLTNLMFFEAYLWVFLCETDKLQKKNLSDKKMHVDYDIYPQLRNRMINRCNFCH